MVSEQSPKEHLEGQISHLNSRLLEVATKASQHPFDIKSVMGSDTSDKVFHDEVPSPETGFTAFLNHYIAATVGLAYSVSTEISSQQSRNPNFDPSDFQAVTRGSQSKVITLVQSWVEDPQRQIPPLQQKTCDAILQASSSFDWSTDFGSLNELAAVSSELGNAYSVLLTGKRLIGF